jgi:serine O-acetyltransferase
MLNSLTFKEDVARFTETPSISAPRLLRRLISEPGLQCVLLVRMQEAADRRGRPNLARFIHLVNLRITGADIGSPVNIGPGFVAKHPLGIVIGGGVIIGSDCTMLGKVTLGELNPTDQRKSARAYPKVGSRCLLGTGCSVLGEISIGNDVKVGAHSLVLNDVQDSSTVVGSPARQVYKETES